MARTGTVAALALVAGSLGWGEARSAATFRIGSSVGLTGYAVNVDRSWRDGVLLAVEALNQTTGIGGRQITVIFEDNRSDPQEAVVGYRKMASIDQVNVVDSGCVSAGNFAAAPVLVRAQIPMVLCSILPPRPEDLKWAFSFIAAPRFEAEAMLAFVKDRTSAKKVGILHDPTPYSLATAKAALDAAKEFGLEVVGNEAYRQDDADLSVQIGSLGAAQASVILKFGQGGSTVTAAKNITSLGLADMMLIQNSDDGNVFRSAAEVLGDRFRFVASLPQVADEQAGVAGQEAVTEFLKAWRAKYGDRDPGAGSRAWDATFAIAKAVDLAHSSEGAAVRDALERLPPYQGAAAFYAFSPEQHAGIAKNPYVIAVARNGKFRVSE